MRISTALQAPICRGVSLQCVMLFAGVFAAAQMPTTTQVAPPHGSRSHVPHGAQKQKAPEPTPQAVLPPPMPHWPVNDQPSPASVVWDSNGLRINASNSSLQQILNEVSTETGSKVEGPVPDQRVYGDYGPGQARDVLSQLLQGSGSNVLLAGDLGKGAPREIVLSPRRADTPSQTSGLNRPQQDPDDEIAEPEDSPLQPVPPPQMQNSVRPGFGPNGPIRTPQQVMEEMQQRQLLQQQQMQQQQMQQQQQQQNPQQ